MLDTTVAIRYARALYKIAAASGSTKIVATELAEFNSYILTLKELKRVLYHPGITATEKKDFVTTLLAKSVNANTVRFINFLIAKKRIFHLASISACFSAMLAEDEKRLDVKVESFKPLSSDLQNRIKDRLKLMTKKDITLVSEINTSLLGGMRLTLGDKVIDGSVSNQLKKLSRIVTAV